MTKSGSTIAFPKARIKGNGTEQLLGVSKNNENIASLNMGQLITGHLSMEKHCVVGAPRKSLKYQCWDCQLDRASL